MGDLALILAGAGLVNNLILHQLLGVAQATALSDRVRTAMDFGLAMLLVVPLAVLTGYGVSRTLIEPLQLQYLRTPLLALGALAVILAADLLLARIRSALHARLSPYIPLTLANGAVLGPVLIASRDFQGWLPALVYGIGSGTGFALALTLFAALHERVASADVPRPFRGLAILLVTLGLLSMAFLGFTGMDKP